MRTLDLALFGLRHLYHGDGIAFDPEGVLSTLPSVVNVLAGYAAATWLELRGRTPRAVADVPSRDLDLPTATHPDLDPIVAIQAFYKFAAPLAEARGMDPDAPRHLDKVTRTV